MCDILSHWQRCSAKLLAVSDRGENSFTSTTSFCEGFNVLLYPPLLSNYIVSSECIILNIVRKPIIDGIRSSVGARACVECDVCEHTCHRGLEAASTSPRRTRARFLFCEFVCVYV